MDKTKVGIIGLGGIAQLVHLPILSKMNHVEIFAASELNKNRGKVLSAKFNIKNTYTDYDKMLEMDELDAVIIATPTNTHEKIALACLNAGKSILIEKPGTKNLEEAQRINKAAKKNTDERNLEIFKLIEMGSHISKGELFSKVSHLIR